jgi:uncharacterized RDD family membrane protein YckC
MADTTIFCSQCGTPNLTTARFCQKCGGTVVLLGTGAAVAPSAPAAMAPASPYPGRPAGAQGMPPAMAAGQTMMVSPYGGFWIRFLAVLLDSVIINILTVPIALLVAGTSIAAISRLGPNPQPEQVLPIILPMFFILFPVIIGINWLYEAITTSSGMEGTVGKRIVGVRVTDLSGRRIGFGRATGRHFAKIISGFMMIGYIMAAFTEKKQGLHDMIAGTLVMKR